MSAKNRNTSEGKAIEIGPVGVTIGLVIVVAVVAFVLWLIKDTQTSESPQASPVVSTVTHDPGTWVTPLGEPAIGAQTAPVTIVEYTDFSCGNCRQFATEIVPWLRTSWLADGFVNIVVRDFAILGPASVLAAEAAHCAGDQGRYWAYHDTLFAAQPGPFDTANLVSYAAGLGLDVNAFEACLASGRHRAAVDASTQSGAAQGFDGTPTYLINGMTVQGAIELERWQALFEAFVQDFARATEAAGSGS